MKSFIFNVYFLLSHFNNKDFYYFVSNLRLTLLIKAFLTKQHIIFFCSILNMTIVCRRFKHPPSKCNPSVWPSPFFVFFLNPSLLVRLFRIYRPNEIPDEGKNKILWQSYFFIFKRLKTMLHAFL